MYEDMIFLFALAFFLFASVVDVHVRIENTSEFCRMSEEMVESILSRLPPKSVMRFKCVHKTWHSLIMSSSFIEKHLSMCSRHTTSIFCKRFVLRDSKTREREVLCTSITLSNDDEHEADSVVEDVPIPEAFDCTTKGNFMDIEVLFAGTIIGHCRGIICMSFGLGDGNPLVLWNPAIKEFKLLPKNYIMDGAVCTMALGYDPKSKDYKVLNVVESRGDCLGEERIFFDVPRVEVYNLSTDSWREIDTLSLETESSIFVPMFHQLYWKGFCYWMGSERQKEYMDRFDRDYDDYPRQMMHSFDLNKEIFDEILLPRCLYEPMARFFDMHIIPWNESIALFGLYSLIDADPICGMHDAYGLWELNSSGNVKYSWTKHLTIDVVQGVQKDLVLWKKDEMLLAAKDGRICTHNFETHEFKYINTSGHGCHSYNAEARVCVNSIVSVLPENHRA